MSKEQTAKKERFLREVERQLLRKGLDSEMTEGGILNVKWHGQLLCDVDGDGVVCFPSKTVRGVDADASLQTVIQIASQVREYMPIFARAPALKAIGLEGSYKILADFGDAVLAGRLGKKGANFVTWEWDFDRNGVHMGHYFIEDYGSWTRADDTQHKRTKTCSACGDSSEEYADHIDANGDGKCDDCGATVSLSIKWDAGTNGGTIDGKASITTTGKPNATATAPTNTPVKTGHAFKGWYTSASGGSLYNTVTITAAKTFYAQFTANSYSVTWDLGNGNTETTKQTYGEVLVLPTEPTRKNAEFLGWFTEANGGTQVDANTIYKTDADSTYYAHWEITEVFSVTVPVVLPLTVDENGEVHVGTAEIINGSTGEVIVSSVSISTKNGWKLVPFDTDMAHAKVDAKQLGFKINDSVTRKTGDAETFSLTSPWTIAENARLPLDYDAVVSAVSQPVTAQDVLSIVFVLEWGGE